MLLLMLTVYFFGVYFGILKLIAHCLKFSSYPLYIYWGKAKHIKNKHLKAVYFFANYHQAPKPLIVVCTPFHSTHQQVARFCLLLVEALIMFEASTERKGANVLVFQKK